MADLIVHVSHPLTLVGGAEIDNNQLNICLSVAPSVVAADGGADHALRERLQPLAVIGDMDSLSADARLSFADVLHTIREQDTTDFEKALTRIKAPLVLALGFLGGRLDHTLSALAVLARLRAHHVVMVSGEDLCVLAREGRSTFDLAPGDRLALMPLGVARATTQGLRWNLTDSAMAPDAMVSSSNAVEGPRVTLDIAGPVLITLPMSALAAVTAYVHAG